MKISKMLGVALVAVLALAVTASAASAATFNIEGTTGPFTVKGAQVAEENHVFTIESGLQTKCKTATFTGTAPATSNATLEITPSYASCTAFGLSATITMNSCKYKFLSPSGSATPWAGSAIELLCTNASPATIKTATCEVKIEQQATPKKTEVSYETSGTEHVLVKANVSAIEYNKTEDGFLCPLNGTGKKSDGKYEGNTTVEGFEGAIKRKINVM